MELINILKENTNIRPKRYEEVVVALLKKFTNKEIMAYEIDDNNKNRTLIKIATIDGEVKSLIYNKNDNSLCDDNTQISINNQERIFSIYYDYEEYVEIIQIYKEREDSDIEVSIHAMSSDDFFASSHEYKDDKTASKKIIDNINIFDKLAARRFKNNADKIKALK